MACLKDGPRRRRRDQARHYDDLSDRNALAAYAGGRHVGSVERRVAQYLAPLVDAGMDVSACVASAEAGKGGAPPVVHVRLRVRHDPCEP